MPDAELDGLLGPRAGLQREDGGHGRQQLLDHCFFFSLSKRGALSRVVTGLVTSLNVEGLRANETRPFPRKPTPRSRG
jgi:hypothetical protein